MKKALIGIGALVAVVIAVLVIALWATSPTRTFNEFAEAIETKNVGAAQALIGEDISDSRSENIKFWIEDWVSYEDAPTVVVERDEAWFERVKTDKGGKPLLNKHGDRDKEIQPVPRYWAHVYAVYATVHFDETEEYEAYDDPMIFTLRRKSDKNWGMLGNIFRGWEVTRVRYQELDDDEYDDLFDEFDFEDEELDLGDLEFELDEDGNVVTTTSTDDTDEEADEDTATEIPEGSGGGSLEDAETSDETVSTDDESVSDEPEEVTDEVTE